jgi:hypothetical protein
MLRARILSWIAWALVTAVNATIRFRFVRREVPERLKAAGDNFLYAFWHGRQFLLLHHYRNSGILIPASESRDGEIQAQLLLRMGFSVVRGSSKRKGARALLGLVDGARAGKQIGVSVDGPRGPVYEVKQGVAYLAGKLQQPIVPVTAGAKRRWLVSRSWDRLLIPAPFTTAVIVYGEPITISGISERELEAKRRHLEEALRRITAEADSYFSQPASPEE